MQSENSDSKILLSDAQLEAIARLFKTLSEPARLRLIACLMKSERTVGELVACTGLKQANVSKHLNILLNADLLARKKEGNFVYYNISEPLLFDLCNLVCTQIENATHAKLLGLKSLSWSGKIGQVANLK